MMYLNVMNRLSVDCDCLPNPSEPDMHDIGVLSSLDPVALDQACVDLIHIAPDGASVTERIASRHGEHTLEYAEELGIGSRSYRLTVLDWHGGHHDCETRRYGDCRALHRDAACRTRACVRRHRRPMRGR